MRHLRNAVRWAVGEPPVPDVPESDTRKWLREQELSSLKRVRSRQDFLENTLVYATEPEPEKEDKT